MNRILEAFAESERAIQERVTKKGVTQAQLDEDSRLLDMEVDEYCLFQELKTLAVAHNVLTAEEGQSIYVALGNSPTTFTNRPLHVKSVLTVVYASLLKLRRAGKL